MEDQSNESSSSALRWLGKKISTSSVIIRPIPHLGCLMWLSTSHKAWLLSGPGGWAQHPYNPGQFGFVQMPIAISLPSYISSCLDPSWRGHLFRGHTSSQWVAFGCGHSSPLPHSLPSLQLSYTQSRQEILLPKYVTYLRGLINCFVLRFKVSIFRQCW